MDGLENVATCDKKSACHGSYHGKLEELDLSDCPQFHEVPYQNPET